MLRRGLLAILICSTIAACASMLGVDDVSYRGADTADAASESGSDAARGCVGGWDAAGAKGGAVSFNATSYLKSDFTLSFNTDNAHTFSYWFYISRAPSVEDMCLLCNADDWTSGATGVNTLVQTDGTWVASVNRMFSHTVDIPSPHPVVALGTWHFAVAILTNNATIEGYFDGNYLGSTSNPVGAGNNYATHMWIGNLPPAVGNPGVGQNRFTGYIDQVSIFSSALIRSEIATLYNCGNGLKYSSWGDALQAKATSVWDLDEGAGAQVSDATGHASTATLTGGPAWTTGIVPR